MRRSNPKIAVRSIDYEYFRDLAHSIRLGSDASDLGSREIKSAIRVVTSTKG